MSGNTTGRLTRREFVEKAGKTAAVAAIGSSVASCGTGGDFPFDVVIKGGIVYDGTLAPPFVGDIGVKGDVITAVGDVVGAAARTIDASGLIVTPGFVDVHTHCDLSFKWSGRMRHLARFMPSWKGNHNYLYQGVTTVVSGNCGYGYSDVDWWLGLLDSLGFGANVYHLVPHGVIREELFGENQPGKLSSKQLDAMKGRVAEEMEKGGVGLSTGLEYAPGLLASTGEIIELAKVARAHGGIYVTHMRDESGKTNAEGRAGILASIDEAVEIGRRAEIPVEISHLKISAPIGDASASQVLDLIEAARLEGLDLTADQYPYAAGSTGLPILLPNEFKTARGVKEEFKTKEGKREIQKAIEEVFEYLPPEKTLISSYDGNEAYEGKNLKEIAEIEGRRASESFADMVCEEPSPGGVFFSQDIDVVRALMPNDFIITASDGATIPKDMAKPHPRMFGTFPKKLRRFVAEEKLLDIPHAIRSMTSLPAEKYGMTGRGRIAEGNFADIAVIDFETLTDHATYLDPHQYSEGVVHLLVNGELSISNGEATGDRGGRALRRT
jgi:N-acyl-D-amino-acid deacylase